MKRVPPGLHLHAARRVDQDHGEVRGRGAGRHVARVLLVARAVGDDELALVGVEVAVGDVDRDALLALGLQAVHQQRQVHFAGPSCPTCGCRWSTAASWSSRICCVSCSRRPISVLLPSSTLPQVMKRSRLLASWRLAGNRRASRAAIRNTPRACAFPSPRPDRSRWRGSGVRTCA